MDLTRLIPYDLEVLAQVVGFYNAAVWPAHLGALALAIAAAALVLIQRRRPAVGDAMPSGGVAGRFVLVLLAAAWLWSGIVYLGEHYGQLNWAGGWYRYAFAAQALLLLLAAALNRADFRRAAAPGSTLAGAALMVFAVAGHPLLAHLLGRPWDQIQYAGLTPDPTNLLTLGLLLLARRPPWWLLVAPALWALLGVAWWWVAGAPDRMILPALSLAAVALLVWRRGRG